jgi:hypothetical protein
MPSAIRRLERRRPVCFARTLRLPGGVSPPGAARSAMASRSAQHRLYFLPEPQEQGSFLPEVGRRTTLAAAERAAACWLRRDALRRSARGASRRGASKAARRALRHAGSTPADAAVPSADGSAGPRGAAHPARPFRSRAQRQLEFNVRNPSGSPSEKCGPICRPCSSSSADHRHRLPGQLEVSILGTRGDTGCLNCELCDTPLYDERHTVRPCTRARVRGGKWSGESKRRFSAGVFGVSRTRGGAFFSPVRGARV